MKHLRVAMLIRRQTVGGVGVGGFDRVGVVPKRNDAIPHRKCEERGFPLLIAMRLISALPVVDHVEESVFNLLLELKPHPLIHSYGPTPFLL